MVYTGRPTTEQQRQKNGFDPKTNIQIALNAPLRIPRPLAPATIAFHLFALKQLDLMLAARSPPGMKVQGVRVHTWKQWMKEGFAFPSRRVIEAVMKSYIGRAKGKVSETGKIQGMSLEHFWHTFQAAWKRQSPIDVDIPKDVKVFGNDLILELIAQNHLPLDPPRDVSLDINSVRAMQQKALDPTDFKRWSLKKRHNVIKYMSTTSHTALRPSSVLAPHLLGGLPTTMLKINAHRQGLKLGCFTIYFFKPKHPGDKSNRVGGYVAPRWAKTAPSRGKLWPLPPNVPCIADSTLLMVLIGMLIAGEITEQDLDGWLDPARFEGKDYVFEQFKIPDDLADNLVFALDNGRPVRTNGMTLYLKMLSFSLGFKSQVTSYAFRHMGIRALREHGERRSDVQKAAGHRIGSKNTGSYGGRRSLHDITKGMANRGFSRGETLRIADKADAQPRPDAPTALTAEQADAAMDADHEVQGKIEQIKLLEALQEEDFQKERSEQIKQAKSRLSHARRRAREKALRNARAKYDKENLHAGPLSDRPASDLPSSHHHHSPITVPSESCTLTKITEQVIEPDVDANMDTDDEEAAHPYERLVKLYFLAPSEARSLVSELGKYLKQQVVGDPDEDEQAGEQGECDDSPVEESQAEHEPDQEEDVMDQCFEVTGPDGAKRTWDALDFDGQEEAVVESDEEDAADLDYE
ncbi:hypothetical protein IAU59_005974 [Kwoniella sp. CBS 9459]